MECLWVRYNCQKCPVYISLSSLSKAAPGYAEAAETLAVFHESARVLKSIADVELVLVQLSLQVADQRVDAFLQVLQVDPVAQHRADVLDLHVCLVGVLFRQTRRQDVLAQPLLFVAVLRLLHAA